MKISFLIGFCYTDFTFYLRYYKSKTCQPNKSNKQYLFSRNMFYVNPLLRNISSAGTHTIQGSTVKVLQGNIEETSHYIRKEIWADATDRRGTLFDIKSNFLTSFLNSVDDA